MPNMNTKHVICTFLCVATIALAAYSPYPTKVVGGFAYDGEFSELYDSDYNAVPGNPINLTDIPFLVGDDFGYYIPGNAPWMWNDILRLRSGEGVILEFDHEVADDPDNPYGLDFTVYASYSPANADPYGWVSSDSDPEDIYLDLHNTISGGSANWSFRVSVSDGRHWYTYDYLATKENVAPICAVTLGSNENGEYWSDTASNLELPVNPNAWQDLYDSDEAVSVATIARTYKGAGGGISFDLSELPDNWYTNSLGQKYIKYIQIVSVGETEDDYIAIAGASDVAPKPPYEFKIESSKFTTAKSIILGHEVDSCGMEFSFTLDAGMDADKIRVLYVTKLSDMKTSNRTTLPHYVLSIDDEDAYGRRKVNAITAFPPQDNTGFFVLEYKDE